MKKILKVLLSLGVVSMAYATPSVVNIDENKIISLVTEVNEISVTRVIKELASSKEAAPILYINSPGGEVVAGMRLIEYIKTSPKPIHCLVQYAASMAHALTQACQVRLGLASNVMLQHRMKAGIGGNTDEMQDVLDLLKSIERNLNIMESSRMKINLKEFQEKVRYQWMSFGQDSLKQNRLDSIVSVRCSQKAIETYTKDVVRVFIFMLPVKVSNCPLIPLEVDNEAIEKSTAKKVKEATNNSKGDDWFERVIRPLVNTIKDN